MLAKVMSAAVSGIDALPVTVEAASSSGWSFSMVGLPDTAVKESYERITALSFKPKKETYLPLPGSSRIG